MDGDSKGGGLGDLRGGEDGEEGTGGGVWGGGGGEGGGGDGDGDGGGEWTGAGWGGDNAATGEEDVCGKDKTGGVLGLAGEEWISAKSSWTK